MIELGFETSVNSYLDRVRDLGHWRTDGIQRWAGGNGVGPGGAGGGGGGGVGGCYFCTFLFWKIPKSDIIVYFYEIFGYHYYPLYISFYIYNL
jgi:hypothetical protein